MIIMLNLYVNIVFRSEINLNDESNVFIESEDITDIDEIFDQLIKKHEELSESIKNTDLMSEGIESITCSFTEIIRMKTFIESPTWLETPTWLSQKNVK